MTKKYPLTYEEYKHIYSRVPRLTVELIFLTDEGVLLTKRAMEPFIGHWHIPGGTVYHKETPEQAVKRVAKNELGVEVRVEKFLGFIEYPKYAKQIGWDWPIGLAYSVKITKGKPETSDQGSEIKYFRKLPAKVIPDQPEFLNKYVLID